MTDFLYKATKLALEKIVTLTNTNDEKSCIITWNPNERENQISHCSGGVHYLPYMEGYDLKDYLKFVFENATEPILSTTESFLRYTKVSLDDCQMNLLDMLKKFKSSQAILADKMGLVMNKMYEYDDLQTHMDTLDKEVKTLSLNYDNCMRLERMYKRSWEWCNNKRETAIINVDKLHDTIDEMRNNSFYLLRSNHNFTYENQLLTLKSESLRSNNNLMLCSVAMLGLVMVAFVVIKIIKMLGVEEKVMGGLSSCYGFLSRSYTGLTKSSDQNNDLSSQSNLINPDDNHNRNSIDTVNDDDFSMRYDNLTCSSADEGSIVLNPAQGRADYSSQSNDVSSHDDDNSPKIKGINNISINENTCLGNKGAQSISQYNR